MPRQWLLIKRDIKRMCGSAIHSVRSQSQ